MPRGRHPIDFIVRLIALTAMTVLLWAIAVAAAQRGIFTWRYGLPLLAVCALISTAIVNFAWRRIPVNVIRALRASTVFLLLSGSILGFLYLAGSELGSSLPIPGVVRDTLFYFSITASVAVTLWIMMRPEK